MLKIQKFKMLLLSALFMLVASAQSAFAAVDLTGVTLDITGAEAAGLVVITALLAIWALYATIALFRRKG
jgi:hypothetical protein